MFEVIVSCKNLRQNRTLSMSDSQWKLKQYPSQLHWNYGRLHINLQLIYINEDDLTKCYLMKTMSNFR